MLNERIEDHLPVHLIETATGALRVSNASHLETKPMLSRTADHLFWMARYMERAENTARLLDVNYQTSLLPQSSEATLQGWKGLLSISELMPDYLARFETVNARDVMAFMVSDANNPSSILNCLRAARENARAVRGALTTEVWETMNQTWLEYNRLVKEGALEKDPGELFEWVKFRSHLSRGVTLGTMLQDESFHFQRIGTFLERADNTARILDVKYYVLLPSLSHVGSSLDNVQWETILRSLGAERAYRWLNAGQMDPRGIADFVILDQRFPRSLRFCYAKIRSNLHNLALQYGGEVHAHEVMRDADLTLQDKTIDEVIEMGLHEFLTGFIVTNNRIARAVEADYRFSE